MKTVSIVFNEALRYVCASSASPDDPAYLEACNVIVANRELLPYRVLIYLPDNATADWDTIINYSNGVVHGAERIIEPLDLRHEFKPSAMDELIMRSGDKIYIRPIGAQASMAYVLYEVRTILGEHIWICTTDPFIDMWRVPLSSACTFAQLSEALHDQDNVPLLCGVSSVRMKYVPIASITHVDIQAGAITLMLDEAHEAFTRST